MKTTNKLMLAAGIIFQLSGSLFADNWSDAFLAFGGGMDPVAAADYVLNNADSVTAAGALSVAQALKTNEAVAVARWMANSRKSVFKSPLQDADVQAAAQAILNSASRAVASQPVNNQPVASQPVNNQPVASQPVNNQPVASQPSAPVSSGSYWNPFSWSSSNSDNSAAIQQAVQQQQAADLAAMQKAVQAQKQLDAQALDTNNASLAAIVNSSAADVDRFKQYVDLALNTLQQAIAAINDPAVQQQVVQYAQSKLSNMKASASYKSPTLGRYSSKKAKKKSKHAKKSHAKKSDVAQ